MIFKLFLYIYNKKEGNKYVASQLEMAIIHQPALPIVHSTIYSQMYVQIKHSVAYLQDLILTLADMFAYCFTSANVRIKSCRYAREECFFVRAVGNIFVELTV